MFRIKLGEHHTVGNLSKGPKIVVECDTINEVVDIINSHVLHALLEEAKKDEPDARSVIRKL